MYNPDLHHRRSIRLDGYDYAKVGAYFVTVCTQNRECLFGEIVDGAIQLNKAGQMIEKWWTELPNKFPTIETDQYIVMPNHFHGILIVVEYPDPIANVGAALRGRPDHPDGIGHPHRGAPTLSDILDWFKTMTTNDHIRGIKQHKWAPFSGKLWQRNYYEHIIRNENDMNHIREYIANNPANWAEDENNPANIRS